MSKLQSSKGKYYLRDGDRATLLLDVRTPALNKSRLHSHRLDKQGNIEYPLRTTVNEAAKRIFLKTPVSMGELVAYLRIFARLLGKPQVHHVLRIGQWSPLDEALAQILPQFNPANKLYCLSATRPLGRMPSVNFLFAEGDEYLLPEERFDTIIFPDSPLPSEVLLAVKPHGRIYFVAQSVEEPLRAHAQAFPLTNQFSLFELEVSAQLRAELKQLTPQGLLDEKKSAIADIIAKLPAVLKKRNSQLDEYIAEVIHAEKLLAEIFPELHSETVKFNFNLLKEFLIDLRLGNGSVARLSRQYEILTQDLIAC